MSARIYLSIPLLCLSLSACSLPDFSATPGPHVIRCKDGRELITASAPVLQEKTGYYRYKTPDNRDAVIRRDDVVSIVKSNA